MNTRLWRLNLSESKLRDLNTHQRYVYALTGHVFNELMLIMKTLHVSRRPPGTEGPLMDASVGTSMFMVRILVGKTHEALARLTRQSIREVLEAEYFSHIEGLTGRWVSTVDQYNSRTWLGHVRNRGAFHYMNAEQWGPHIDDELCSGAYIWVGARYSDTYYHWAEMAAALPAMRHMNEQEPFVGLATMLDELGVLLGALTDCLARGLQAFTIRNLLDEGAQTDEPVEFDSPDFETPQVHYFYADPRLGRSE